MNFKKTLISLFAVALFAISFNVGFQVYNDYTEMHSRDIASVSDMSPDILKSVLEKAKSKNDLDHQTYSKMTKFQNLISGAYTISKKGSRFHVLIDTHKVHEAQKITELDEFIIENKNSFPFEFSEFKILKGPSTTATYVQFSTDNTVVSQSKWVFDDQQRLIEIQF